MASSVVACPVSSDAPPTPPSRCGRDRWPSSRACAISETGTSSPWRRSAVMSRPQVGPFGGLKLDVICSFLASKQRRSVPTCSSSAVVLSSTKNQLSSGPSPAGRKGSRTPAQGSWTFDLLRLPFQHSCPSPSCVIWYTVGFEPYFHLPIMLSTDFCSSSLSAPVSSRSSSTPWPLSVSMSSFSIFLHSSWHFSCTVKPLGREGRLAAVLLDCVCREKAPRGFSVGFCSLASPSSLPRSGEAAAGWGATGVHTPVSVVPSVSTTSGLLRLRL
mmetsp:Transcript_89547/g.208571  ORF Transcript_89547/g.208571 Transcript_89547/m.208571 type:complete len:272 (+) Transcript_89547:1391-2206(+)